MAFKLKDFSALVGIDKETSTYDTPVFVKDLEEGVLGEANNDGTIYIDKSLQGKRKQEVVNHEKKHREQMLQNRLYYDDNIVTWKKDTKSPTRVYVRDQGDIVNPVTGKRDIEGGNFEWEKEADKLS